LLVVAHRGASFERPENTLAAFERAIEIGAAYVEFDVHNDLSVTHDPPQRRLAYPTLEDVLELCHGRIGVMVELKRPRGATVERTLRLLHDDDVLVYFQRAPLVAARELRPGIRTVQHVGFGVSIARAGDAWAVGFQDQRVTPRGLARAQAAGYETLVYTVNNEARMSALEELGVSGIFTDRPAEALIALSRISQ
jgi:glycerophosphoryl diester phosphodiesterase